MSDNTPRLGIGELAQMQEMNAATINEAFVQMDALSDVYLLGQYVNTPPSTPADGDTYLTGAAPTGVWTGHAYKLAYCLDGGWRFFTPFNGLRAFVGPSSAFLIYKDGSWIDWGSLVIGGATSLPSGFLTGLTLSNNTGTPNTKLDVAAGKARDDGDAADIAVTGGTIDCGATGINGLDTGSLAAATWYHVFAIAKADGTAALLASTSAASPTLPGGYARKRRVGSFRTDASAHIIGFTQNGDEFQWNAPVEDANNVVVSTTAAIALTLSVPTGVKVEALFMLQVDFVTTGAYVYLSSPDQTDVMPSASQYSAFVNAGLIYFFAPQTIRTDISAQVRLRFSATDPIYVVFTRGWRDARGR